MKEYTRYSQAYKKAAVGTMDQRKLIIMLYDGAIRFLNGAITRMQQDERYEAHKSLAKAKSIIAELLGSLNLERGGDIAQNLQRLYIYMFNELIEANMNKDIDRINQVVELLKDLRDGWQSIKPPGDTGEPGEKKKNINLRG